MTQQCKNTSSSHDRITHQDRNQIIGIDDNNKDTFSEKVEVSGGKEEDDGACDLGGPEILNLCVERAYMFIEYED